MICPDCGAKISTKHFDATYGWYECGKCEGCFTPDEILEGELNAKQTRNKKGNSGSKKSGGRGKKRPNSAREAQESSSRNGKGRDHRGRTGIVAKGKKRRAEAEEDNEAVEEYTEQIFKNAIKVEQPKHHRDEVEADVLLGAWQDEIQAIYEEDGIHLDEVNARDKALIIWREVHHHHGATARAQAVPHAACEVHA